MFPTRRRIYTSPGYPPFLFHTPPWPSRIHPSQKAMTERRPPGPPPAAATPQQVQGDNQNRSFFANPPYNKVSYYKGRKEPPLDPNEMESDFDLMQGAPFIWIPHSAVETQYLAKFFESSGVGNTDQWYYSYDVWCVIATRFSYTMMERRIFECSPENVPKFNDEQKILWQVMRNCCQSWHRGVKIVRHRVKAYGVMISKL